jgi:site-specific recombinase XerD
MKREDLSPVTVRGYVSDLEMFIAWLKRSRGTKVRLNQISTIELINYRQHLIAVKGLKPATVNRRLEALRRFCKWACNQTLHQSICALSDNPVGLRDGRARLWKLRRRYKQWRGQQYVANRRTQPSGETL